MSTVQEKQARIINALVKSNQRGKIQWKIFDGEPGCVFTEIAEKYIYLNNFHSDGTDSIKVEIYYNDTLADDFLDDDLSSSEVQPVTGESWFVTLKRLLEDARRKATGADEVLDSLLKDLGYD